MIKEIIKKLLNPGILTLIAKIGPKLLSIIIKFAKVGKAGLAIGSMVSYAYIFSWQFAIMIMIALFFHETGHLYAMKKCGLKTKGIYFIPFLGAAAVSEEMFKSRRDEVYIAIMGPIWGFVLSILVLGIYFITGNAFYAAIAGWMALVNLFNLLPVNPLDGGRIVKSIIFSMNSRLGLIFLAIGIIISIILTFWVGLFLFALLLFIGSIEFIFEYRNRDPNMIINKCTKDLDEMIDEYKYTNIDNVEEHLKNYELREEFNNDITNSVKNLKNILQDNTLEPILRIKIVKDIAISNNTNVDTLTKMWASFLYHRLERFDHVPKMNKKGIIISFIAYVIIIGVLWLSMTYMENIPDVNIARQLFMS